MYRDCNQSKKGMMESGSGSHPLLSHRFESTLYIDPKFETIALSAALI